MTYNDIPEFYLADFYDDMAEFQMEPASVVQ